MITKREVYMIHVLIVAMLDEHGRFPKDHTQKQREDRVNNALQSLLDIAEPEPDTDQCKPLFGGPHDLFVRTHENAFDAKAFKAVMDNMPDWPEGSMSGRWSSADVDRYRKKGPLQESTERVDAVFDPIHEVERDPRKTIMEAARYRRVFEGRSYAIDKDQIAVYDREIENIGKGIIASYERVKFFLENMKWPADRGEPPVFMKGDQ